VNNFTCRDPASEKAPKLDSPVRVPAGLHGTDPFLPLGNAAFTQEGYPGSLEVLNDGEESLAYVSGLEKYRDRIRYPLPSAIVSDLQLPGMSGFDVLTWIRERPLLVTIPVYVLTHSRQPQDIQRAFALGAGYVSPSRSPLGGMVRWSSSYPPRRRESPPAHPSGKVSCRNRRSKDGSGRKEPQEDPRRILLRKRENQFSPSVPGSDREGVVRRSFLEAMVRMELRRHRTLGDAASFDR